MLWCGNNDGWKVKLPVRCVLAIQSGCKPIEQCSNAQTGHSKQNICALRANHFKLIKKSSILMTDEDTSRSKKLPLHIRSALREDDEHCSFASKSGLVQMHFIFNMADHVTLGCRCCIATDHWQTVQSGKGAQNSQRFFCRRKNGLSTRGDPSKTLRHLASKGAY